MEQPIPHKKTRFTVEEYLQMEEASQTKHEFRHGRIIDMAGGTMNHALIAGNIGGELRNRLKGKPCKTLGSDMRVRITGTPHYCYPDVTVVCGQPVFDPPDRQLTLINPQVVIEVISPSTAADDRADKFYDYIRIESLMEYFIVSHDRMRVDTFYRQKDGIWAIGPSFEGDNTIVKFRSLDIAIPMSEIYAGVEFPKSPTPEATEPPAT
jgi:Uma2 family endonuclease